MVLKCVDVWCALTNWNFIHEWDKMVQNFPRPKVWVKKNFQNLLPNFKKGRRNKHCFKCHPFLHGMVEIEQKEAKMFWSSTELHKNLQYNMKFYEIYQHNISH